MNFTQAMTTRKAGGLVQVADREPTSKHAARGSESASPDYSM